MLKAERVVALMEYLRRHCESRARDINEDNYSDGEAAGEEALGAVQTIRRLFSDEY